jgi:molecular chaperone HscA
LNADADLLDADEKLNIDTLMAAVSGMRAHADAATIEAATQALAKGTENFAAQRMNRGIQKALAGKNISAV